MSTQPSPSSLAKDDDSYAANNDSPTPTPTPTPTPPSLPLPLTMPLPSLTPRRPPQTPARQTQEMRDERCWFTTKQTNAGRALSREPKMTMYCYLNFRHALADLVPVIGLPGAYIARDESPAAIAAKRDKDNKGKGKATSTTDDDDKLPAYHWPALDGRYLYIARGKAAIRRHLDDMGSENDEREEVVAVVNGEEKKVKTSHRRKAVGIEAIKERCEKSRIERELGERERRKRRILGIEDDHEDYERLIPLSDAYSNTLRRFHAHVLRIYTPFFNNLARLPSTFTDGTQTCMLETVYGRLTDGSAFTFGQRLWDSTWRVAGMLAERRKRENEGGGRGGAAGGGGMPPLPPLPPPGGATPV